LFACMEKRNELNSLYITQTSWFKKVDVQDVMVDLQSV
jgi:hypothetical protein